ncbi:MAG TPA: trypsin-like serine protease, partial [Candidatus Acidoferrum sp.]|nr:trypsin-like serine protease [Candidatus Acidoferrum sp.]
MRRSRLLVGRALRKAALAAVAGASVLPHGCGPSVGPGGDSTQIVGGFPISIEEAPWQVSLQDASAGHFCGGAILTERFVVTAQHCTAAGFSDQRVLAGVDRLSDSLSGRPIAVAEVIPFPGFTGDPADGKDVSLLRLAEPLALDGARRAPIPIADARAVDLGLTAPGVVSKVSGWGALTEGGPAP